ncbi:LPS-assembly protein LptD [soil metagenome]
MFEGDLELCHCTVPMGTQTPASPAIRVSFERPAPSRALAVVLALLTCSAFTAHAQQPGLCRIAAELADVAAEPDAETNATIEVSADEASLARDGRSVVRGNVRVEQGARLIRADEAVYDEQEETVSVVGNVEYRDPRVRVRGDRAFLDASAERVEFTGTEFELPARPARGQADALIISGERILRLDDVSYTTCATGENDWQLVASRIRIDQDEGTGTARNVRIDFQGVPILYTPWLSFPISDARKSGFLVPEFGRSSRSGTNIGLPYYWNIAPNLDATLTPRYLSQRGLQLNGDLRYLTSTSLGGLRFEYFPNEKLTADSRGFASLDHVTLWPNGVRLIAELQTVSDDLYFEDLGRSLSETSVTHLPRDLILDYRHGAWRLRGRAQNFRTIDGSFTTIEEPYERLPQLVARAQWPNHDPWGLVYGFDGELVHFERDQGVTGTRLDVAPNVSLPLGGAGYFFTPAVDFRHTRYWLDQPVADQQTSNPSRTLPQFSVDSGAIFERVTGTSMQYVHTLEPRVLYVHIPHAEQADLPIFDTGLPEFNLVQLYRENRFVGADRVGDTDKLSVGLTSRLLDAGDGRQYLAATLGQAFFLSEQAVELPDQHRPVQDRSNYIAELAIGLYRGVSMDLGYQWDPALDRTAQAEMSVGYRSENGRILNFAYRFRRNTLEQSDVSFAWPIADRWRVLGRLNYSLLDETTLERLLGFEYETCCWGLRLVSRRHISRRTGESDTAVAIQLELKGLANVGDAADRLLERGILGYTTAYD